mmetsp:Transcript_50640/g.119193  ORF Transcript_50640/g.119193 Transcript_50640/m.119193 type:complete len:425 (+) Transcript_50640:464-1738(+)
MRGVAAVEGQDRDQRIADRMELALAVRVGHQRRREVRDLVEVAVLVRRTEDLEQPLRGSGGRGGRGIDGAQRLVDEEGVWARVVGFDAHRAVSQEALDQHVVKARCQVCRLALRARRVHSVIVDHSLLVNVERRPVAGGKTQGVLSARVHRQLSKELVEVVGVGRRWNGLGEVPCACPPEIDLRHNGVADQLSLRHELWNLLELVGGGREHAKGEARGERRGHSPRVCGADALLLALRVLPAISQLHAARAAVVEAVDQDRVEPRLESGERTDPLPDNGVVQHQVAGDEDAGAVVGDGAELVAVRLFDHDLAVEAPREVLLRDRADHVVERLPRLEVHARHVGASQVRQRAPVRRMRKGRASLEQLHRPPSPCAIPVLSIAAGRPRRALLARLSSLSILAILPVVSVLSVLAALPRRALGAWGP